MRTYDEPMYAADRLVNTIVRHKGLAVKVMAIDPEGNCGVKLLSSGRNVLCKLAELDITPVPLGYVNFNARTTYLSRCPVRRDWKQGLRPNTMRCTGGEFGAEEIPNKVLAQAVENDYPTLAAAFDLVDRGTVHSVAFCRDFALFPGREIQYKGVLNIGNFVDTKDKRYKLNDNAKWAMESLEAVING